ncbi:MAG TPA: hypothetical protein PLV04_06645, partial [Phenylobacterium sp.]|nr:hypothetical protein [Phenylobacterium sp.]
MGQDAADRPAGGRKRAKTPGSDTPPGQAFARAAILSTLLLLAIYTVFAIARIQREPQSTTLANAALPDRADAVAARLDGEASGLKATLLATRSLLQQPSSQAADAAQLGLAASAGAASGVAVVGEDGVLATAGDTAGINWQELAQTVERT